MCVCVCVGVCVCVCVCVWERERESNWLIGLVDRVFANCLEDLDSIPGSVIPKTLKMVLDTTWLNTQQNKVRFKGKVE